MRFQTIEELELFIEKLDQEQGTVTFRNCCEFTAKHWFLLRRKTDGKICNKRFPITKGKTVGTLDTDIGECEVLIGKMLTLFQDKNEMLLAEQSYTNTGELDCITDLFFSRLYHVRKNQIANNRECFNFKRGFIRCPLCNMQNKLNSTLVQAKIPHQNSEIELEGYLLGPHDLHFALHHREMVREQDIDFVNTLHGDITEHIPQELLKEFL